MRFAWYSDFDGVFNIPASTKSSITVPFTAVGSTFLKKYNALTWEPKIIDILNSALETEKFDFTWLTTWNDAGNIRRAMNVMGINSSVCQHFTPNLDPHAKGKRDWTRWKAQAIIHDQSRNPRPYIWVDDDAPTFWHDFVRGHTRSPGFIVQTNSRTGITQDDIIRIINWTLKTTS